MTSASTCRVDAYQRAMAGQRRTAATLRRFNRAYTQVIGTLSRGYLDTPHSLQEARVIYEIAQHPGCTAKGICEVAGFDQGYLSRLVSRLEDQGLVTRKRSGADGRQRQLHLTAAGKKAFGVLDRRANGQAQDLVSHLSATERRAFVESLDTVQQLLGQREDGPLRIRPGRVGDLGVCFGRQVAAYEEEFGFTLVFERYFAQGLPAYLENFDPDRDRLWVAERGARPVGWIAIHHDPERSGWAKLRWFFVARDARGGGLGWKLMRTAVDFSASVGYRGIFLWTVSNLDAARALYERAGFRLAAEKDDCPWAEGEREQCWELELTGET